MTIFCYNVSMETMEKDYVNQLENERNFYKKKVVELEEQLAWLKKQVFGKKSERYVEPSNEKQLYLSEELEKLCTQNTQEVEKTTPIAAYTRKILKKEGKDAIVIPDGLPVEEKIIDIPEKQKISSETGKPLVKIGEEVSTKLAYKPKSYFNESFVPNTVFLKEKVCYAKNFLQLLSPDAVLMRAF